MRKRILATLLALCLVLGLPPGTARAVNEQRVVYAGTVEELRNALSSDTKIVLEGKDYNVGSEALCIFDLHNVTIQGTADTRIIGEEYYSTNPNYNGLSGLGAIISIDQSTDICIQNLSMGYMVAPTRTSTKNTAVSAAGKFGLTITDCNIFGADTGIYLNQWGDEDGIHGATFCMDNSTICGCISDIAEVKWMDTGSTIFTECMFSGNGVGTRNTADGLPGYGEACDFVSPYSFYGYSICDLPGVFTNCTFINNKNQGRDVFTILGEDDEEGTFAVYNNCTFEGNAWDEDETAKYTFSYNINTLPLDAKVQGTLPAPADYAAGETVTVTTATIVWSGFEFKGWTDGTRTYEPGSTFTMPEHDVRLTAVCDRVVPPIDGNNVFIQQGKDSVTCTLVATTTMLRRRAILDGDAKWDIITERAVGAVAWGKGLSTDFPYGAVRVKAEAVDKLSVSQKKAYFISMLKTHPEGIVVYYHGIGGPRSNSAGQHAVLLTDYDSATDTFYCADPGYGMPKGRITLSRCAINGNTQTSVLGNIHQIWFVYENAAKKTLVSSTVSQHCPVEMQVTVRGEQLDSSSINGTVSNIAGDVVMTASGSGASRNVTVTIPGTYVTGNDVNIKMIGTDTGVMTFAVKHEYADGSAETHTFSNVPVTNTTVGNTASIYPQSTVLLALSDANIPGKEEYWVSDPNTVSVGPSFDFDYVIEQETSTGAEEYYISIPAFSNGEIIPTTRYATSGERVTLTAYPDKGYKLDTITVTDMRGRAVTVRKSSGNSYYFTMPGTRVTADAKFVKTQSDTASAAPDTAAPAEDEPFTGLGTPGISGIVLNPAAMPFTDVRAGDWFYDHVEYVWKHYLMSGVSDTEFSPNATTTRAMIWTVLARMNNVRTEVNPGNNWYERGMLWAVEQGITDGSSPMGDITREQLATMLWRGAGSPGATADLSRFSDSAEISNYAKSAVNWAVANGILNGSDGKLNPQGTATRAQVAAMVMRYGERMGA